MERKTRTRQSGRAQKRKRYTVDAFDGLETLIYASSDSGASTPDANSVSGGDEEFDQQKLVDAASHEDDGEDDISDGDATGEDSGGRAGSEPDDDDVIHLKDLGVENIRRVGGHPVPHFKSRLDGQETFSRGLMDIYTLNVKQERVLTIVGSADEDIMGYAKVRDRWMNSYTLPTRPSARNGGTGPIISPFHTFERRQNEMNNDWAWYYDLGGAEKIKRGQAMRSVKKSTLTDKWPQNQPTAKFIAGPLDQEKLHVLPGGASLDLNKAFSTKKESNVKARSGWIVNFGSPIQCLEWVPNNNKSDQLLAVSAFEGLIESREAITQAGGDVSGLSSFTPMPAKPSSLYVYEFNACKDSKRESLMDMEIEPKLRAVFNFEWNALRRFKWCPVPNRDGGDSNRSRRLGLAAGIWLDGRVRILDLSIPQTTHTAFVEVRKAAFEACPPNTICTSVAWLSADSIAVGCANGSIAIWNISQAIGNPNPRPWFYKSVNQAYIVDIVAAYPSRPNTLFAHFVDGTTKMLDIRDCRADIIGTARHRVAQPAVAWQDTSQACILSDDNYNVEGHYLRYFYPTVLFNRWNALVLNFAASPFHGNILSACTDGTVGSTNTIAKMRGSKRSDTIRQAWFKYEWRDAQVVANITSGSTPDQVEHLKILNEPLGRFTDGYKPEQLLLDDAKRPNAKKSLLYATLYEEKSAIQRVSWSPNIRCATWAVAATGSGLLRVEDLGIEPDTIV